MKASGAGFSVSRLVPNPLLFLEATGEVYPAARTSSGATRELAYVGRLRG